MVLLIWRGWGIVIPILALGAPALSQWCADSLMGSGTYRTYASILFAVAWLVVAVIVWVVGRYLNQRDTPQARSNFQVAHSFALLRMEYWAFLFILGATVSVFAPLF